MYIQIQPSGSKIEPIFASSPEHFLNLAANQTSNSLKTDLRALIAKSETDLALQKLLQLSGELNDADLRDEVLLQSARYQEYTKGQRLGITSQEDQQIAIARINQALIEIIANLPEQDGETTSGNSRPATATRKKTRPWKQWVAGAGVLIALLAGLAELTGYSLRDIFGRSTESSGSESLTVFIHSKEGKNIPILQSVGKVEITYGNKKDWESIDDKGKAVFNEIPAQYFQENARVSINVREVDGEPYRALYPDSLYQLKTGEPVYVAVVLAGLDKVFGTVRNGEQPLADVVVSIGALRDTTNDLGYFELAIPENLQKKQQQVHFYRPGFRMLTKTAFPQTGEPLQVFLSE